MTIRVKEQEDENYVGAGYFRLADGDFEIGEIRSEKDTITMISWTTTVWYSTTRRKTNSSTRPSTM